MKNVNLETITDTQSWYKIWLLNGHSHTCVKSKLLRRRTIVKETFSSRRKSRKSFTKTINSLEFGKAGEDLSWNLSTSTPHRSETNGIAETAARRKKELPFRGMFNALCEMLKTSCQTGKHLMNGDLEKFSQGPVIPFGSMMECRHLISAKDQRRLHQFGKKILPGMCLGYALCAGRIWEGAIMAADIEELEKLGRVRSP